MKKAASEKEIDGTVNNHCLLLFLKTGTRIRNVGNKRYRNQPSLKVDTSRHSTKIIT
jgi:hypothetical protein